MTTSHPPAAVDDMILAELLRSALGQHSAVTAHQILRAGSDYAVIAATLADPAQRVVVKLAGPHAELSGAFDRTAAIVRLLRARTEVPTFDVLAADVSYRRWPWRYLIMTSVPGRSWAELRPHIGDDAGALARQLGQLIAAFHAICFPVCGEIDAAGRVPRGASYDHALLERARRRIANPRHADLFASLVRERADLFDDVTGGVLCHEDLNPHNILVADVDGHLRISGLLDFDSAWAGHPESDLARLELWRGMQGDEVRRGYESVRSLSPEYLERRPLYQLLWCLEYARPTPEHLADTARLCAALDMAPITFP